MVVFRNILLFLFALCAIAVGTDRTVRFVLELRHGDQAQDARIDELESQLRDVRARLDPLAIPARAVDDVGVDENAVYAVPVGASPSAGPRDAWVTVVAFLDYQCPFCGRVEDTLDQLQRANPDVRLVVKSNPLPFHPQAMPAALAAECANEEGSFWALHRALFTQQRDLAPVLAASMRAFDLDDAEMTKCRAGAHAAAVIADDVALARRVGASGTPSFFINGKKLVGAQPLERFQATVDAARTTAQRSGFSAAEYYERAVLAGATVH